MPTVSGGGGAAAEVLARAWAQCDGNDTPATIDSSYNFASIDDDSTGNWTLNFTTDMADVDYSVPVGMGSGGVLIYINTKAVGSFDIDGRLTTGATNDGRFDVVVFN